MNRVFLIILSLTLSASILILVLILCRPFLKDKFSRQWQYYIWLIVIIRLLFPLALDGSILDHAFEAVKNAYYGEDIPYEMDTDKEIENSNGTKYSMDTRTSIFYPIQETFWLFFENIWLVWIGVALLLLIKKITVYKSFVRYVRAGMVPIDSVELLDQVSIIANQIGVHKAVELCMNPLISSPLIVGFFRPLIVIPSTKISDKDFYYIVLHELVHLKRCDIFYKWLVQITKCIHWFNPLVYFMENEITKACEFSCDEVVMIKAGSVNTKEYGDTLLEAMASVGRYQENLVSVTLYENIKDLKERLVAIVSFRRKSRWITGVSIVLTIIFIALSLTTGAYTRTNPSEPITPDNKSFLYHTNDEVTIMAQINAGGVAIMHGTKNQIGVDYDDQYYDVKLMEEGGEWKVTVTGKKADMGPRYVKLYLPDTNCSITANVFCGSLLYELLKESKNSITITAADASLDFSSPNGYLNYNISVLSEEPEFMQDSHLNCPDYFSQTKSKIGYKSSSGTNEINILLKGFTNINFE